MDRIVNVAEQPPSPHWVAAYAMGLASSSDVCPELIARVVEACGAHAPTLCEARRELYRLEIFDERLRTRAGQLIWLAAQACDEGVSPASLLAGERPRAGV